MQALAEGFDILRNANKETLREEHRYDFNLADVAEVWRRGSVVSSWLLDLAANALAEDRDLAAYSGVSKTPARAAGPCRPRSMKRCRPRCSRPRCMRVSVRARTTRSPRRCCRRCASSSAATSRNAERASGAGRAAAPGKSRVKRPVQSSYDWRTRRFKASMRARVDARHTTGDIAHVDAFVVGLHAARVPPCLPLRRRSRRKSSPSGGARASTRPRTTRCSRRSRSSRPSTRSIKVELSQYAPQDMIPKTVAALDAGNPPDVAYGDVYDFQVTAKWAYDGKLEDVTEHHRSDARPSSSRRRCRPPSSTTTNQEARLLRLPDQAADHAHPVLEGHAGRGGLQGKRHPEGLEGLLGLLVRQGAGRLPPEDRQPRLRHRPCRWAWTRATPSSRS